MLEKSQSHKSQTLIKKLFLFLQFPFFYIKVKIKSFLILLLDRKVAVLLSLLVFVFSCGDDVNSSRKNKKKSRCDDLVSVAPNLKEYKNVKKLRSNCPGYDNYDPGVANFVMNGIKVDVPRDYIDLGKYEADGVAVGVSMHMIYPEMKPEKSNLVEEKNEISVFISARSEEEKYAFQDIVCEGENDNWCYPRKRRTYMVWGVGHFGELTEEAYRNALPKKEDIKYDAKLDMNYYTRLGSLMGNGRQTATIYFRGDVADPDYWFLCEFSCKTYFYMKENRLYVNYFYNRDELLQYHNDIHAKILQKLNQFIKD